MMTQSMHYQYIYEYYALAEELKSNATPPLVTISIYLDNNRVQSNLWIKFLHLFIKTLIWA